jgi:hypothetical protein
MRDHMAKKSRIMFDNFEIKGEWWLPSQPENKVIGILSFNHEMNIKLQLIGSFRDVTSMLKTPSFQPEIIIGISESGDKCTLVYNMETNKEIHFGGIPNSLFVSRFLLIGKHFTSYAEIRFASLQAHFTNLEEWLCKKPFQIMPPAPQGKPNWQLVYSFPACFNAILSSLQFAIKSTYQFSTEGDLVKDVIWRSKAFIVFTPETSRNFDWYLKITNDFSNLLTLFIGETTYMSQMKAFGNTISLQTPSEREDKIEIFYSQKKSGFVADLIYYDMIIQFPKISATISHVLELWYTKADQLRSVYDLYFASYYNPTMYMEFIFLALMQSLESFHRCAYGGKYLSDDEWKEHGAKIVQAIPNDLESSFKESLRNRIKYGNEYSLRKRMNDLFMTLNEKIRSSISPSPGYFTGRLVDARNYFTHYDDGNRENALSEESLYEANQRLQLFLTVLLLKILDIDDDVIIKSLADNRRLSTLLIKENKDK